MYDTLCYVFQMKLAPGFSESGKDIAYTSVVRQGRKFYEEKSFKQALELYNTALSLVCHRGKNEQFRVKFMVCLCMVESGAVEECVTAITTLKTLLPAAQPGHTVAHPDDANLPRTPIFYLLTIAYYHTWQSVQVLSIRSQYNFTYNYKLSMVVNL